ncbi:MAG: response regulator [Deltaproteobacteria bacterium]|nr:response regulator [Deltaproteobacteria bacterium]
MEQTILVVDDEQVNRVLMGKILSPSYTALRYAADGEEALAICRREPVDLVVSDLYMAPMDGVTFLKNLRQEGLNPAFLVLTSQADQSQALDLTRQYGIAGYLIKPITNAQQFLFHVNTALEKKRLEQLAEDLMKQVQAHNLQLEQRVAERTAELVEKNLALERLSKFRGDVLNILGHELNTPLALLQGYFSMKPSADPAQAARRERIIQGSIFRIQQLVDQGLTNLRAGVDNPHFHLSLKPVDPLALAQSVVERLNGLLAPRNLHIDFDPPPPPSSLSQWDAQRVESVMEELLVNAVRATPDGGKISLVMKTQGGEGCLLTGGQEKICLFVENQGTPLTPQQAETIFQPFVTLGDPSHHGSGLLTQGAHGSGLGLSASRIWAELHGGKLAGGPLPDGSGNRFSLCLPNQPVR